MNVSWVSKRIPKMLIISSLETICSEATTPSTTTWNKGLASLPTPRLRKATSNNQQSQNKNCLLIGGTWTRLRLLPLTWQEDYWFATCFTTFSPSLSNGFTKNCPLTQKQLILYFLNDQFKFIDGTVINESSHRVILLLVIVTRGSRKFYNS